MQELRGTGVALVTPFKEDLSIDFDGLTRLIEHNISNGVDYLVILGTTGEVVTLTKAEKDAVIAHVIAINAGRKPLVLGLGGNNTAQLVQEFKTQDFTGFTAVLSVSPSYNKPTQRGIYAHFEAIAQVSPLPVIVYNVPSRTGTNMLPETVMRLAHHFPNIIGVKEALGDMLQVLELLRTRPKGFLVISGDDALALPLVSAGGDGVISVMGQATTALFSEMIAEGSGNAFAKAYEKHYNLTPLITLIFKEGNPAGIKSVLAAQGICKPFVRLPLVPASSELTTEIQKCLSNL